MEHLVTFVTDAQISNNPWVSYSYHILPMVKISSQNITQRETKTRGLGDMSSRCSPDCCDGGSNRHPVNVGCSFFKYTNDGLSHHTNQRHQHRKCVRETNLHFTVILGATLHK